MKNIIYPLFILSFTSLNAETTNKILPTYKNSTMSFTENKGQVIDQNYQARPDILFGGQTNGLTFHLRNNGISYQLNRIDSWKEEKDLKTKEKRKVVNQQTIYRIDINWLNANTNTLVKKDKAFDGVTNFYTEGCPEGGALNVKSYKEITYQNLYTGIDLKWYEKNGELKYDYICSAGADYKQIQLQPKGSEELSINAKGELVIKTPLGTIIEKAPLVLQNGKELKSKWVLTGKILNFEIQDLNKNLPYIIDPAVRVWGTYYGGTGGDISNSCNSDASGNVYMTGYTQSGTSTLIATVGAHQTTFGGSQDAFLAKFNSSGVRQWGTYYGGSAADDGASCSIDGSGNVYVAGATGSNSGTLIASSGSHQSAYGGGFRDAFLVKFDASGIRQWGTYYGGTGVDEGTSCSNDASGNIYLLGRTTSATSTAVATAAAHQTSFGGTQDVFLVKFNSSGVRQWGTYYGGTGIDNGKSCSSDASGNVYISGVTSSNTGTIMATTGAHQAVFGGGTNDAFLIKFNSTGARQWGTYYGGSGDEDAFSCSTDPSGNIYIAGYTPFYSGTVIVTAGAHQAAFGGVQDAFLVKFNSNGLRQWGTYYGGSGVDDGLSCSTDASSNVYLGGRTASNTTTLIATTGAHQTNFGGGTNDAFLVSFNSAGVRQWGTYYGGSGTDEGFSCTANGTSIYLTGWTNSNTGTVIASSGGHQTTIAGANDGFLVKFIDCTIPANPINTTPSVNQVICEGNSTTLTATSSTNTINWYSSITSTTILASGNFVTPLLSAGNYTYYAEASSCALSPSRTAVSITVNPNPTIVVNSGVICSGNSFTIVPGGANTYTIQGGNAIVSPTINTTYTVTGTNSAGCVSQNFATSSITVNPNPTITAVSNASLLCVGQTATLAASGALSYIWNTTATSAAIAVSPTITTTYTVNGTDANGCGNAATITQAVSACTGLDNLSSGIQLLAFQVYPNPSNGNFEIVVDEEAELIITNGLGQIIQERKLIAGKNNIDLSNYANGIYFINAISKTKNNYCKFIKQ